MDCAPSWTSGSRSWTATSREAVPELPDDIDIAIHSAATVAFDPPIDEGFQTNLFGAMNLYRGVIESGSRPCLVHISTAYVAGVAKGVVPEDTLDHRVDWRTEGELALQARRDVEAQSRRPEMLDDFMDKASKEHSRAGPMAVAEDAEQRRKDWVIEAPHALRTVARPLARMARRLHVHEGDGRTGRRGARRPRGPAAVDRSPVDHRERVGASRARVDRRVQDGRPDHPRIRPGSDPGVPRHPGGDLGHHPGGHGGERDPGGRGHAAEPRSPAYYHVSSGSRNPLQYHELYRYVRQYFEAPSVAGAGTRRAQGARVVVPGQPERRAH